MIYIDKLGEIMKLNRVQLRKLIRESIDDLLDQEPGTSLAYADEDGNFPGRDQFEKIVEYFQFEKQPAIDAIYDSSLSDELIVTRDFSDSPFGPPSQRGRGYHGQGLEELCMYEALSQAGFADAMRANSNVENPFEQYEGGGWFDDWDDNQPKDGKKFSKEEIKNRLHGDNEGTGDYGDYKVNDELFEKMYPTIRRALDISSKAAIEYSEK